MSFFGLVQVSVNACNLSNKSIIVETRSQKSKHFIRFDIISTFQKSSFTLLHYSYYIFE